MGFVNVLRAMLGHVWEFCNGLLVAKACENLNVSLSLKLNGKKKKKEALSKSLTNGSLEEIEQCRRLFHVPFS